MSKLLLSVDKDKNSCLTCIIRTNCKMLWVFHYVDPLCVTDLCVCLFACVLACVLLRESDMIKIQSRPIFYVTFFFANSINTDFNNNVCRNIWALSNSAPTPTHPHPSKIMPHLPPPT